MVNHQVYLKSIKPPHAAFALAGKLFEHLVRFFPAYLAHFQLFGVYKIITGAEALRSLEQQYQKQQRKSPFCKGNKTLLAGRLGKATMKPPQEAFFIVVFKAFIAAVVIGNQNSGYC